MSIPPALPQAKIYGVWKPTVTAGLIAVGFVAIFGAAYAYFYNSAKGRDVITFLALATAGAAAVVSSYYASATIRQTAILQTEAALASQESARQASAREQAASDRARVKESLRIIGSWNDPLVCQAHQRWRVERAKIKNSSDHETRSRLDTEPDSRVAVQDMLNRLEEMSIAVLNEFVDEKTLREFAETLVFDAYHVCGRWIEASRADSPNAWIQLEKLYKRWHQ